MKKNKKIKKKKIKKSKKKNIDKQINDSRYNSLDFDTDLLDKDEENINSDSSNIKATGNNKIINDFFKDICKIKLLKPLEEKILIKNLKNQNKNISMQTKHKILNSNLRLVISIAKKYFYFKGNENNFLDIIFSGVEGLLKTLSKFDYTKDIKFSTYAHYWIVQRIRRSCLLEESDLKIPVHHSEYKNKIFLFQKQFFDKHYRKPTYEEIKKHFKLNDKKLFFLLNLKKNFISLDCNNNNKDTVNVIKTFINSESIERNPYLSFIEDEKKKHLNNILNLIDKRTKNIFTSRYGFIIEKKTNSGSLKIVNKKGQTLQKIGLEHNITTERVRQINHQGLKKILKYIKDNNLEVILKKNNN
jgi:RNA polymerase primary sigma factor